MFFTYFINYSIIFHLLYENVLSLGALPDFTFQLREMNESMAMAMAMVLALKLAIHQYFLELSKRIEAIQSINNL